MIKVVSNTKIFCSVLLFCQKLRRSSFDTPIESSTNTTHTRINQGRDTAKPDLPHILLSLTEMQNQAQPSNPSQSPYNSSINSSNAAQSLPGATTSASTAQYLSSLKQNDLANMIAATQFASKACDLLRISDFQTRLKLANIYLENSKSMLQAETSASASSFNSPDRASRWLNPMMENLESRLALVRRIGIEQQQLKTNQSRSDSPKMKQIMSSSVQNILRDNLNRQETYFGLNSPAPNGNLLSPGNQQQRQQHLMLRDMLSSLTDTSIRRQQERFGSIPSPGFPSRSDSDQPSHAAERFHSFTAARSRASKLMMPPQPNLDQIANMSGGVSLQSRRQQQSRTAEEVGRARLQLIERAERNQSQQNRASAASFVGNEMFRQTEDPVGMMASIHPAAALHPDKQWEQTGLQTQQQEQPQIPQPSRGYEDRARAQAQEFVARLKKQNLCEEEQKEAVIDYLYQQMQLDGSLEELLSWERLSVEAVMNQKQSSVSSGPESVARGNPGSGEGVQNQARARGDGGNSGNIYQRNLAGKGGDQTGKKRRRSSSS